jgi:hypothetical protein
LFYKEEDYESKTFGETNLREVQDHQAQRARYGDLRESEAQAEAGLTVPGANSGAGG